MNFTRIPENHAPLGGAIRYAATATARARVDVRITDQSDARLLGAKRFAEVTSFAFDAAPYLRQALRFVPTTGRTGFRSGEGRSVTATVEAAVAGGSERAFSEPRTFLPNAERIEVPALVTALPRERLIGREECDELTFVADEPLTLTVTARSGATTVAESYVSTEGGLQLFRLCADDFPGAELLRVDAGVCGEVGYSLVEPPVGSTRLAWRSRAGSVEHYTFPIVKRVSVETVKSEGYGEAGYFATAAVQERRTEICSAFETRAVLDALAEILAAERVWQVEGDVYVPIDVVTRTAVVHRQDAMSCLEIEIRPTLKTVCV